VAPAECRVGKNDPGRQGRRDRPSRGRRGLCVEQDSWEGATQLGVWVAVSRFLKFPILGNFAEIGKSRLRPSGRTFPRLAVGGYTRKERWRAMGKSER
jgi:hypothetical protein